MNYDKPMTGIAGQSGRAGPKVPSDTTTGDVPSVTIGHGSVTTETSGVRLLLAFFKKNTPA